MIALLATLGVDLGLLVLTILNPPAVPPERRGALARNQARLQLPTDQVVRQLTAAIETAIARAPGADLEWVRRHFLHHDEMSFFIIPNLYSVKQDDANEELRALAINQLAGVLDDLELIRSLTRSELQQARKDEERESRSKVTEEEKIRNHGLLSKGRRLLDIAGWSKEAQQDMEVYRLVDTEGLTPLLMVLNEATIASEATDLTQEIKPLPGSQPKQLPPA